MPLRAPQVFPQDQRSWDQWARAVTVTPDTNSVTTLTVADKAITNTKLRDSAAASVIGRLGTSPGTPADIVASADNTLLVRRAGALIFATLGDADIPDDIARDTEVAAGDATVTTAFQAADAAHVAAGDPHPQYTTAAEVSTAITAAITKGTFTPTVLGATSAGTATYATQLGRYRVIGDACFFNLRVQWSAASGTGNFRIGGLPVTASNADPSLNAVVSVFVNDTNITDILVASVFPNTTLIQLEKFTVGTGHGFEALPAAGDIMVSGFYPV